MSESAEDVRLNFRGTYENLAQHSPKGATEQFGAVTAISAGMPTPVFNRVFVFEPFGKADLMAAIDWFTNRDDPFWVTGLETLREDIEEAFTDDSYEKSDPAQPGMSCTLPSDFPSTDTDIEFITVTEETERNGWTSVAESVFEFSDETNRLLTPQSLLDNQDVQFLVGRVDEKPVSCGMLSLSGTAAGVYVIGVLEEFRRRGFGEAMTWEVLREGQTRGAEVGVLLSRQMAIPLYERMGFETVTKFRHFAKDSWL